MPNSPSNDVQRRFRRLARYATVTAVSYGILLFGSWILVEVAGLTPTTSYAALLTLVYIGVFIANTRWVFGVDFARDRAFRFLLVLVVLWLANNLVFNLLTLSFGLPYLVAIVINLVVFGTLRYVIQHRFVFFSRPDMATDQMEVSPRSNSIRDPDEKFN